MSQVFYKKDFVILTDFYLIYCDFNVVTVVNI